LAVGDAEVVAVVGDAGFPDALTVMAKDVAADLQTRRA
jgi:hypothetical protein